MLCNRNSATATPMVTLSNQPNTWGEPELQEGTIDEETETCVGDEGDRRSIAPTNYLRISKCGAPVEGQYILDLSLSIPPPSPGIAPDADRKNLTIHTTSGPITAEIWIKHDRSTKSKRVSLDLYSGNGAVRAIVHDPLSPDTGTRAFLDMELRAYYGDISLSLPRCFRGPITIRTGDDRVTFSPALEERTALISDVPGVQVYFVGDRPRSGKWGSGDDSDTGETLEDSLDELTVNGRYTSVRINWDGEEEVPIMKPNGWQVFCGGAERFFTSGRVC